MIIDEELMSDVQTVISGASHALARDYRLYTPAQDIAQEMWVWCVKHPGKISDYLDREEKSDRLRGMKALNKTLMRLGVAYCRREKAAISGYHPSDEYFYTRSLIGALLEAIWNDSTLVVNMSPEHEWYWPGKTRDQAEQLLKQVDSNHFLGLYFIIYYF